MTPQAQRFISGPESPLEGVHRDAWQRFVTALETQPIDAVSESGGLGSYDIRPRRLVELGYASGLSRPKTEGGVRQVQICEFVFPWTQARFLADPVAQYVVVAKSMKLYYDALRRGDLKKPDELSFAGALAILHRGGRGALESWPNLFENTRLLYEATKGAF